MSKPSPRNAARAFRRVNEPYFIPELPVKPPTAGRNILTQFRRCGRGILKGAAFRQRPLSRILINFLAGTRKLPPEEPEPKHSLSVGNFLLWDDVGIVPYEFLIGSRNVRGIATPV